MGQEGGLLLIQSAGHWTMKKKIDAIRVRKKMIGTEHRTKTSDQGFIQQVATQGCV